MNFIVQPRESNAYDDFEWDIQVWHVRVSEKEGKGLIGIEEWRSGPAFERSVPRWLGPLSPWEQYAQALLISNEFMFVD